MDQVRVEIARLQRDADGRIAVLAAQQRGDDQLRIGSVIGFVASCILLGIATLLRRREQQASQRLFEGVMENASIGIGVLDPSLRLRHINHALAKMSERALSASPGMSIWDVIPQLRDTLETRLQRVLQGGGAANADVEAASNTRADQLRSYEVNFYPLGTRRDDGGRRHRDRRCDGTETGGARDQGGRGTLPQSRPGQRGHDLDRRRHRGFRRSRSQAGRVSPANPEPSRSGGAASSACTPTTWSEPGTRGGSATDIGHADRPGTPRASSRW